MQHRHAFGVADGSFLEPDQWTCERLGWAREGERHHPLFDLLGDRLHARQRLDAALRLRGLGGLGLEALDERLDVAALVVLLLPELQIEALLLAARFLELVVAACVEGELALAEVQNGPDRAIEKLAVVADDQHGVRIVGQILLQPECTFQVEVVGGLVEQQQIGLGEQHRAECDAHAPTAGELGTGAALGGIVEAEAGQDAGGARWSGVRTDVGQALVDQGDALGIVRGLGFLEETVALRVGGQHEFDQAVGAARRLLGHPADAHCARQADAAVVGMQLAGDQLEQRGLARAVATDESDLMPGRNADRGFVEDRAALDAVGEVIDVQHRGCT